MSLQNILLCLYFAKKEMIISVTLGNVQEDKIQKVEQNFNPGSALRVKFLPENNWVQPRPQGLLAFQYAAILESEKTLGTRLQLVNETREE